MKKEPIHGTYKGVPFNGLPQFCFLLWCEKHGHEVKKCTKVMQSAPCKNERTIQVRPQFYLPNADLNISILYYPEGDGHASVFHFHNRIRKNNKGRFAFIAADAVQVPAYSIIKDKLADANLSPDVQAKVERLARLDISTIEHLSMPQRLRVAISKARKRVRTENVELES